MTFSRDDVHKSRAYVWSGINQANQPVVTVMVWGSGNLAITNAELLRKGEIGSIRASLIPASDVQLADSKHIEPR